MEDLVVFLVLSVDDDIVSNTDSPIDLLQDLVHLELENVRDTERPKGSCWK